MTVHSSPAAPEPTQATKSPATVRIERVQYGDPTAGPPLVSIVVPTRDGCGRGLLDRLKDDLRRQTLDRFELVLVIGDSRQGRAINRGVREAKSELIVTMDDDTEIGTQHLLRNLRDALLNHPDVGLVGASTVIPSDAGWMQCLASRQIPRREFPIYATMVDSDMVQHPCLAIRKSLFWEIGGEDEEIPRGLDPLLRYRVREAGYRVVIAPHTYISHPLPERFWEIVKLYFRNGKGSAFVQRHFPDRVYNLTDGFQNNQFSPRIPFPHRVLRYPGRMAWSLLSMKWIRLSVEIAYAVGFVREYLTTGASQDDRGTTPPSTGVA